MKKPLFKCVIFDLDGTLLYTLTSINKAINETLRNCGYPEHPLEKTIDFVNFGSVELVRRALPEDKRSHDEVMRVHELYLPVLKKYASDGTKPYDGICEVCRELRSAGVTLCVMSNKPQKAAEACIEAYFEKGLFDVVRGSVPGKFIKPEKSFTMDVIKEAKVNKEDCVLVGDSVVDLDTAKNAGCPCIWVKWGYGNESNIGGIPDFTADTPSDITRIILN